MRINWKSIKIKDLAGLICQKLIDNGIDTVLTGGACVTIYSSNKYVSGDLDFITYINIKNVTPILRSLGFIKKSGRHYEHPKCPFFVEFLAPPIAIGSTPVKNFAKKKTKYGFLKLLTVEDSIKDRLAAYYYWNDMQSLDQAVMLTKDYKNKINLSLIRKWSKQENQINKYKEFSRLIEK